MTLIQSIGIGAAALIAITASIYLTPRHVTVERKAEIETAYGDIIARAGSTSGFTSFNPYRTADPDLKIEPFGPDRGIGSGFRFDGKDGKGTQTVTEISDTSVTYEIDLGPMGQPKQVLTAVPHEDKTLVTWRVEADMGLHPVARVFGLFMDRMMGKTLEQGLANLKTTS